jgi:AcrR family transcriptional regulator
MLAAKHIIATDGYERTTTAEIAEEAGTTEAELLLQFGDKPGLLEAMFNTVWEPLNSRIADMVVASLSARHAAGAILSAMLHVLGRDADLARLLLFESRRQHGNNGEIRLSRGFRDFETLLLRVVERGQKDGSFTNKLEPSAVASALLGAAEGMVRDRMLGEMLKRPVSFNENHLRLTFEAVVRGLAP